jgi:hypothetical protein
MKTGENMSSGNTVILSADTICEKAQPMPPELTEATRHSSGALRSRPRAPFRRPVLGIPIRVDGAPDWASRIAGTTLDIGLEGIGLEFPDSPNLQTLGMVLNISLENGQIGGCLGIEINNQDNLDATTVHVGGEFTGFAHDLLKPENLTPKLNSHQWQFELAYPEHVLEQWVKIGVLEAILWDRLQLCPRCQGLPTFRRGCQACGSVRFANDQLLHHFACAHVGLVDEFLGGEHLQCPKCRTSKLVIGTDYEVMTGPFRCQDCHWAGTELEQVAHCMRCELRYPANQSHEQELKGYRANRLDPLALLPALGSTAPLSVGTAPDRCAALCVH